MGYAQTKTMNNNAVLYARVSSKDQEREGFSIPAQLDLLRSYAAGRQLKIAEEFVDVETAKQAGRGAFGQMVAYARKQPGRLVVLVEKTDRLYRNLRDWVTIDELDAEIHLVKENVVLSPESRSHEKFMHGIKVLMAKNYVENLGEETKKGMAAKAKQGIWPSFAPPGYCNVIGADGKRTIEPDPIDGPLITRLFARFAKGDVSIKYDGTGVSHNPRAAILPRADPPGAAEAYLYRRLRFRRCHLPRHVHTACEPGDVGTRASDPRRAQIEPIASTKAPIHAGWPCLLRALWMLNGRRA